MRQPSPEYLDACRKMVMEDLRLGRPLQVGGGLAVVPMLIIGFRQGTTYYGYRLSADNGECPADAIFYQDAVQAAQAYDRFRKAG